MCVMMMAAGLLLVFVVPGMPALDWVMLLLVFMPVALYVCDLMYRRRSLSNNRAYAGVWTLWYLYVVIFATHGFITTTSTGLPSSIPSMTGLQFAVLCIFGGYGIPFLTNLFYFLSLPGKSFASPTT
jgi:uncharacterized membrane protein